MMRRIWIVVLATLLSVGIVDQSSAEEPLEGLSRLSAMCSDESASKAIEVEAKRALAIAKLCDATILERLFSSELSGLDRGCNAVKTSFLTSYASLLADPEKAELTCADVRTLLSTVNRSFRDAMNE